MQAIRRASLGQEINSNDQTMKKNSSSPPIFHKSSRQKGVPAQKASNTNRRTHAEAVRRKLEAYELRVAGVPAVKIARRMNVSDKTVWRYISERLSEIEAIEQSVELKREHWQFSMDRLETIYRHHFPQSAKGNTRSAAICLRAVDQMAKLCGLEGKPVQTDKGAIKVGIIERIRIISPILADRAAALVGADKG